MGVCIGRRRCREGVLGSVQGSACTSRVYGRVCKGGCVVYQGGSVRMEGRVCRAGCVHRTGGCRSEGVGQGVVSQGVQSREYSSGGLEQRV